MKNNYIFDYYQQIKDESVTVGKFIEQWYEYVVHGLENGKFRFNQKDANRVIEFCEAYCRHHEGALAPNLIKLELWQKAFLSVVFGIKDKDGNRQFREIVLVIGRKNGKTLLAAAICAYCAYKDGEYGGRIYMAAPKLQQANLCYDAFYQMVKKDPNLNKRAKRRRSDVYIEASNTSVAPLAFSAKKSDGLNISLCIADEVASWEGDSGLKFYEVLKSSFGSRRQPMLLNITTSGYINDGVYDELIKRCTRLLKGDSKETRLAPFLYMIDDVEKWNQISELKKSNPNLGVSITVDYLLEEIRIAEGSLSKKAETITKYANIKQNSSMAWFNQLDVDSQFGEPLKFEDFSGCYAVGGIDLSQTTDLTACVAIVEKDGILNVFSQFFMPSERIDEATARDGIPYNLYIKSGHLKASGDNFVDYHDCYSWFTDLIEKYKIYPLKVGYDRYSAQYLVQDMSLYGFNMDDVFQGENLTPCINELDGLMRDRVFNFGDNNLLKMHLLDSALKANSETNRKRLIKTAPTHHIDGCAALLDAMTVRQKYWDEIGLQLQNKGK